MGEKKVKHEIEYVEKIFYDNGLELLDKNYVGVNSKLKCKDRDGYLYEAKLSKLNVGELPHKIYKTNPYTIKNIQNYINISNIELYIDEEKNKDTYNGNTSSLIFTCSCGKDFKMSWNTLYDKNKTRCDECMKKIIHDNNAFSYDFVSKYISDTGCELISDEYINNSEKIEIKCVCGNIFKTSFANFRSGKKTRCNKCVEIKTKNAKTNEYVEKYFSNGNINPCNYCTNNNVCDGCKVISYFKRNYINEKEINNKGWSTKDIITILSSILYCRIEVLNDLLDMIDKNKSLVDIVDLLDTDLKIGGNKPQLIKIPCSNCGSELIRSKMHIHKERVYCDFKCRDELRSKIFVGENSIYYRNNKDELVNKLVKLKEISLDNGYELIDDAYVNNRGKLTLVDKHGYKYMSCSTDIENGIVNKRFSINNEYSIQNIRRYLKLKNISCKLISTKYTTNVQKMEFECECGNRYFTSLTGLMAGKTSCDVCSGRYKWNYKEMKNFVENNSKRILLSNENEAITCNSRIRVRCECGNEFSTLFHQFQRGIICCEDCRVRETRKHDIEYVKSEYIRLGYTPLFDEYTGYNDRHTCLNDEGYKVSISLSGAINSKNATVFGHGNPHTKENILKWMSMYAPSYKLLEENVLDCRQKILFECEKGHRYRANWTDFQMGRRCPKCKGDRISKALSNDIDTFKAYVIDVTNGEYECVSDEYVNAATKVKFIHTDCGREFYATPAKFTGSKNRNGSRCPLCQSELTESVHATVLKQLFKRYKKDVILEDPSCINPFTSMILPTDIVCYDEKVVVEVQSWFHDRKYQKMKDAIKKRYWENRGFTVYTPDVRDYSSLTMAQLFFSDMDALPDWIDYKFGRKQIDIRVVQDMLNEYKSTKEIGDALGVSRTVVQNLIKNGEVEINNDHWKVLKNVQKIYKLSLDAKQVIAIYDNATEAARCNNTSQASISHAARKIEWSNYHKGFLWVTESNYVSGNYKARNPHKRVGKIKVARLTLDGELIKVYDSLTCAAKELKICREYISDCVKGNKKSYHESIWMDMNSYNSFKNSK